MTLILICVALLVPYEVQLALPIGPFVMITFICIFYDVVVFVAVWKVFSTWEDS